MLGTPLRNAMLALSYIALVVIFMTNAPRFLNVDNDDSLIGPILFLSMFVFSAAVMAYLFIYPAAQLLIEGKRQEAVNLFFRTLVIFAVAVIVFAGIVLAIIA